MASAVFQKTKHSIQYNFKVHQ